MVAVAVGKLLSFGIAKTVVLSRQIIATKIDLVKFFILKGFGLFKVYY